MVLGEVARLSPEAALQRLSSTAVGLTPGQVKARLRSAGPNQVARQTRHTILGELVGRSINPLNALLLALATASYFLGDQRAAIMDCRHGGSEHLARLYPGTSLQ
jgi:Mg2+-importing ATPase